LGEGRLVASGLASLQPIATIAIARASGAPSVLTVGFSSASERGAMTPRVGQCSGMSPETRLPTACGNVALDSAYGSHARESP